jgi:hypothetical protein
MNGHRASGNIHEETEQLKEQQRSTITRLDTQDIAEGMITPERIAVAAVLVPVPAPTGAKEVVVINEGATDCYFSIDTDTNILIGVLVPAAVAGIPSVRIVRVKIKRYVSLLSAIAGTTVQVIFFV